MKHLHRYPGPCPNCKSTHTGLIMYGSDLDDTRAYQSTYVNALRHGDLRKYKNGLFDPERTAFCDECGIEWRGEAKLYWMSDEDWLKFTSLHRQDNLMRPNVYFRKQKKLVKKQKKKAKRKKWFSLLARQHYEEPEIENTLSWYKTPPEEEEYLDEDEIMGEVDDL